MSPPKIHDWATTAVRGRGLFSGSIAIVGAVYGHPDPRNPEGKKIITSRVESFEGRLVITHSGSRYLLGRISPRFRRWLRKARPEWNWREPLRVIESKEDVARFMGERAPLMAAAVVEDYIKAGGQPAGEVW